MQTEIDFTASLPDRCIPIFINERLRPLLPHSLPLYRRCQFHLQTLAGRGDDVSADKSIPASAEIWVAVSRESASSDTQLNRCLGGSAHPASLESWLSDTSETSTYNSARMQDWLAAYINLSTAGETQIWLFASWEASSSSPSVRQAPKSITHVSLFRALYNHLRRNHIPHLSLTPSKQWQTLLESGKLITLPYSRSKVLFGTVAEPLWPYFEDDVIQHPNPALIQPNDGKGKNLSMQDSNSDPDPRNSTCMARHDLDYNKFILSLPRTPSAKNSMSANGKDSVVQSQAPPGFHFGPLSRSHMQLMLDRTVIPRTLETLQSLVSVGLFPNDDSNTTSTNESPEPIAWGVLGKDASLSSIHTEEKYRGRGFAEYISRELIRRQAQTFTTLWPPGPGQSEDGHKDEETDILYAHTDVSTTNRASQRVFGKMGGKVGWKVGWIEVDIGE